MDKNLFSFKNLEEVQVTLKKKIKKSLATLERGETKPVNEGIRKAVGLTSVKLDISYKVGMNNKVEVFIIFKLKNNNKQQCFQHFILLVVNRKLLLMISDVPDSLSGSGSGRILPFLSDIRIRPDIDMKKKNPVPAGS